VPIQWERQGDVGVGVIDRPERRNALNAELCEELLEHLDADGGELRAVVIGGTGEKAFCAGADLGRRAADTGGLEHGGADSFRPAFEALLDAIVDLDAPVVAAINGAALGAGMQLAVACDVRVVAPHAVFGIPAARLGVLLSSANVVRLVDVVGQAVARDVLLTSRSLEIDEAERVGLVQRRADDPLEAARTLAQEIAVLAPLSISGHKRALNLVASARALPVTSRQKLSGLESQAFASGDLQEGLAAFSEKRPPQFRGE
jgi:enoyl-CoA hydratase/carnithine racemase